MGKNIKRFLLVLLCTGISYTQALSVGDIAVETALNQPLKATIGLRNIGSNSVNDITVSLARPSEFELGGIEYLGFLRDLRFNIVSVGDSASKIEVTTKKAIREPYVNFLVSIKWPNGQLLKEFTILLDPVFGDTSVSSTQASIAEQIQSPQPQQRQPAQANQRPAQQFQQRFNSSNDNASTVTVLPQDTLWNIATRVAPSNRSVHQVMHALKSTNPDAFIDNNINALKAGYELSIPTESEYLDLSIAQAVSATRKDIALWKGAPTSTADTSLAVATRPAGELQLAAADDTASAAVAAEQFDALSSENEDLSSRVGSLEEQVDDLSRLLELKNKQLALLQQQAVDSPTAEGLSEAELATTASLLEETPTQAEGDLGFEAVAGDGEVAYELVASAESSPEELVAELAANQKLTGGTPQNFQPTLALWQQVPIQLGGLGGACVLLMMGLWLRRSAPEETFFVEDGDVVLAAAEEDDNDEESAPLAEADTATDDDLDELENLSEQFKDEGYDSAIVGLEAKVSQQAHRADLRLLLLQKSSEAGDKDRFIENYRFLEAIAKPEDLQTADRILLASQGSMAWLEPEIDDDDDFFKEIVHEAELTDEIEALLLASEGETSLDDQQDLEDFDFESFDSSPEPESTTNALTNELDDNSGLDFEQTLIISPDAVSAEPPLADDNDLDFNFDSSSEPSNTDTDLTMPSDMNQLGSELAEDEVEFEGATSDDDLDFSSVDKDEDFDGELDTFSLDGFEEFSVESDQLTETDDVSDLSEDSADVVSGFDIKDSFDLDGELDLSEDLDLSGGLTESSTDLAGEFDISDEFDLGDELDLSEDLNLTELEAEDDLDSDIGETDIADFDFSADTDDVSLDEVVLSEAAEDTDRDEDDDALEDFSGFLDGVDEAALADEDEIATKLELGEAFIEMGDLADADEILKEVLAEGDVVQQATARELLDKLNS